MRALYPRPKGQGFTAQRGNVLTKIAANDTMHPSLVWVSPSHLLHQPSITWLPPSSQAGLFLPSCSLVS